MTAPALTILIADDDDLIRHLLALWLQSTGYRVALAANGEALVRAALANQPALIVTDLEMPILDGIGATQQLRADRRTVGIPILLISAHPDAAALALDAGADAFLLKPFLLDELLRQVIALLERAHRRP